MADALAEDGGDDAVRRPLHQLRGKATTDAVAHIEEFVDAEVVYQPQLIVGKCVPRIIDRHWAGGFSAIGIALVHQPLYATPRPSRQALKDRLKLPTLPHPSRRGMSYTADVDTFPAPPDERSGLI